MPRLAVLVFAVFVVMVVAYNSPTFAQVPFEKLPDPGQVDAAIVTKDEAKITAALADVEKWLVNQPGTAASIMQFQWLPALLDAKRFDDVDRLATRGTLVAVDDLQIVEALQRYRVRALWGAGKNDEARAAAKGLYNVCRMKETSTAISAIADALKLAHPDDKGIVARFKLEQLANAQPVTATRPVPGAGEAAATSQPGRLLQSVAIDPAPYEKAIEAADPSSYAGLFRWGNLLLLAGLPDEAKTVFDQAYQIAPEDKLPEATESVARTMKAQDGSVGRANVFVMSVRPTEAAATPTPK